MLYYALVFLVVGLIAGVLGATGVAAIASQIAWILFIVGIILLVIHLATGRRGPSSRRFGPALRAGPDSLRPLRSRDREVCCALLLLCLLRAGLVSACERTHLSATPEIVVGSDEPPLLLRPGSLKFAVIGDSGRWSTEQRQTAAQLAVAAQTLSLRFRVDARRQQLRRRFAGVVRSTGSSSRSSRCSTASVKFYASARQSRRGPAVELSVVQHGWQSLLHVRANAPVSCRRSSAWEPACGSSPSIP